MSDGFDSKKFGSVVVIPFAKANVTTGADNEDMVLASALAAAVYVAPKAGSVVGISAACGAITAGTITLKPHLLSTEYAQSGVPQPVLNATYDTNGTYATIRAGAIRFAAGAQLGISASGSTDLNPTNTVDVDAFLHIQLDP